MLNNNQTTAHITIDNIERDLLAFRTLLDARGEVLLVNSGSPMACLLAPTKFKDPDMKAAATPTEKLYVS